MDYSRYRRAGAHVWALAALFLLIQLADFGARLLPGGSAMGVRLGLLALIPQLLVVTAFLNLWPDFMENCHSFRAWVVPLFFVGNELLRYGPLFLSGGFLFLGLNK